MNILFVLNRPAKDADMPPNNDLSLEKLKIHQRLEEVEAYIKSGLEMRSKINDTLTQINTRTSNLEFMVHGNPNAHEKYERDGMNRRIENIETIGDNEKKTKKSFLDIATGSITLAIGGAITWLLMVIREAFINKNH